MSNKDFMKEVGKLDQDKLKLKLVELKKDLMKIRFQKATGNHEKSHMVSLTKRNIARVNTLINQQRQNGN